MDNGEKRVFTFGDFRLDAGSRTLSSGGKTVALTSKVFDTLLHLVANNGRVVDKDELMRVIWADTIVEENNLNKNISKLRQVLGERPGEHKFIATVPGKGYKFVADVAEIDQTGPRTAETAVADRDAADHVREAPRPAAPATPFHRRPGVLVAAAAVVLIAAAGLYRFALRTGPPAEHRVTKLAILPFKPLMTENRDEALELGIAETLIARLGSSGDIVVRPLGSVRKFVGVEQDVQAAGEALGVDAVLDGSIQRSGDEVRVTARLVDVATGRVNWNGTYDEQFTNIFSVQDRIAGRVAEALKVRLNENGSIHSARRQTENPEAYRLYLQGRYFSQKITPPEVRRGITYFQEAIDADPTYALAYAGMADAYRSLPINGDVPSDDAMPKARAAASKALEIDPQLADAHIALGYVNFWFEHDWAGAEREFRTALELSPNNADAHRGYSILLTCLGRHDEAFAEMQQARSLDPLSIITAALAGQTLFYAGRYDEAVDALGKAFELDPNFWVAHIQMARVRIQQNDLQSALAEAEKAGQFSGGNSEAISLAAYAWARAGNGGKAAEALDELKAMSARGMVTDYNTAMVLNGLGRRADAIASLRTAVDRRDVRLILIKVDPKWDDLRGEPGFEEIMRRVNF